MKVVLQKNDIITCKKNYFSLYCFIFCLFLFSSFSPLSAQTTQVQFGQNRVQYHPFDWQYYNSANFTIYFYPGGQEIGKFVWGTAEKKLKDLDNQMDFHYRSQVDILVYNDITDLAQTNIGLGQEDYNIGGTAVLRDNKLFLHYDGNHRHLQRDLMKGLSDLYIRQMMAGNSFGQKIQNAIFLILPNWYRDGLSAYMGEPWNNELDAKLKQYLQSTKKPSFSKLVSLNPEFAGNSFWYMVSELYGNSSIPNILYLTRVNHNINKGFIYSVNTTLEDLMRDWKEFYLNRYEIDDKGRDSISGFLQTKIKKRNFKDIGDLKVSSDGKYVAFAAFEGGFYKIFVQDLKTQKVKQVGKGGFHSDQYPFDKSYPILTWTKSGHKLAVISEKKDIIRLKQIDMDKHISTKNNIIKFQKVHGADFTNNPNMLIVSGQNKGQTDLYLYNTANSTTTQLNNDNYDDLNPVYVNWNGNDGVLFSSNRIQDQLYLENIDTVSPTQTLDLFYYDLNKRGTDLARVTETPFANEKPIGSYNESYYTFISDENGISNQYIGTLDSFFVRKDTIETIINEETDAAQTVKQVTDIYKWKGTTFPVTDFSKGIERAAVSKQNSYLFFGVNKRKTFLYTKPVASEESFSKNQSTGLRATSFRKFYKENPLTASDYKKPDLAKTTGSTIEVETGITLDSLYNEPSKYTFESDYNSTISNTFIPQEIKKDTVVQSDTLKTAEEDVPPPFLQNTPVEVATNVNVESTTGQKIRILPYRAKFTSDYVVTQLDNSILGNNYQSFQQNLGRFDFPNLGAMINFGVSDLMEDHKIIGGFRIPFNIINTAGFEAYVKYINLKKRIDKSILYYRKNDKVYYNRDDKFPFYDPNKVYSAKQYVDFLEFQFSYPFDVTKSLRWSVSYRNDRLVESFRDEKTLLLPIVIKENWLSAHIEFVHDNTKEIQFNILNGFRYKFYAEYFYNANDKKSNMINIGFDIRHYQKVYRNIIWANRFAGASSFGQKKVLYFLGGVDTWLNPKYSNDIPIAQDQSYGLQASVTNLRGLPQNIRNGNNYLIWNSELRIPIFSFFAKKPIKSAFLKDFQLVGFFDAGIAYNYASPFNKNNGRSTEVVTPAPDSNPVVVTVNYYRNPFVFGTGAGFRTNILGYFIRLDAGFGYDGLQFNKKPVWHFSLSKDF